MTEVDTRLHLRRQRRTSQLASDVVVRITSEDAPMLRTRLSTEQCLIRSNSIGQLGHHRTIPQISRMSCRTMPETGRHSRLRHHYAHRILRPSYCTFSDTVQLLSTSWWVSKLDSLRATEGLECVVHKFGTTIGVESLHFASHLGLSIPNDVHDRCRDVIFIRVTGEPSPLRESPRCGRVPPPAPRGCVPGLGSRGHLRVGVKSMQGPYQ